MFLIRTRIELVAFLLAGSWISEESINERCKYQNDRSFSIPDIKPDNFEYEPYYLIQEDE